MVSAPSVRALERNLSLSAGTKWTDRRRRLDIEDWCRLSSVGKRCRKRFVAAGFKKRRAVDIFCSSSVVVSLLSSCCGYFMILQPKNY